MAKFLSKGFWESVASIILRNRPLIIILVLAFTVFLGFQWRHMRFTYTEANLLPDDHEVNLEYQNFKDKFGEEGNLIVLGIQDERLFTPEILTAWNELSARIAQADAVALSLSLKDLKILDKQEEPQRFDLVPFMTDSTLTAESAASYRKLLFDDLPFYENLIYNKETGTVRSAVYLKKDLINTPARRDFVVNDLIPAIADFEAAHDIKVRTSGMPYIRTLNAQHYW